ncbi:conserved hypothetical protein [Planktothrix sp. PCC 11201]|uniref:C39 family peptidase n=1 Tax=Planktothrix sp. PCC 11201 TaxID=1729650 RepID=UPI000922A394|nr:C39 family peptidase [Planktothrix sp. PCC 11201]SKB13869.1 conserved hypothetical protein [Planktothrix sp. PCC 11201]
MYLKDFIETELKYDFYRLKQDQELSSQIQEILINQGFLHSRVEDVFGNVSIAALERFQKLNRCYEPGFLGTRTAQELLESDQFATRGGEGVPFIQVRVIKDTLLKTKPLQSDTLLSTEKHEVKTGTTLKVTSFEVERGHLKFTLADTPIEKGWTWYVFGEHAEVSEGNTKVYPKRDDIKLPVPYKSQQDNTIDPDGSCNVTSIAMCLEYLKIPRKHSEGQFEDELYNYALNQGLDWQAGDALAKIVRDYGAKDHFTTTATIEQVKDWLANGNPAVVHGYFTKRGHIIALVGYDSQGFIVHDPYGEWFADGYDRNEPDGNDEKGKFIHYSYGMIKDNCIPDGQFFVHFISR